MGECRKMKIFKSLFCLMVCLTVSLSISNYTFSGNEKKVIRVPDYQMTGFNYTDANNVRSGYGYEILQEFAKYTDWTYEYVKCDRSECFDLLEKGEIDLIDTCVYTEEYARSFDYSDINAGYGNKAVIVRSDNHKYKPNDFENYNGMIIGIADEDFWEFSLTDFCEKKVFHL